MSAAFGIDVLSLMAIPLAFLVGFALRRGSVCMVEGTRQAVVLGRSLRLRAFIVAAGAAGCVILPLAWVLPGLGMLAPAFPMSELAITGGVLFGLGARINGGCQFGTLGRLAGGETNYAFTCLGAVAGALLAMRLPLQAPGSSPLASTGVTGILVLAIFALLAAPALRQRYLRNLGRAMRSRKAQLSPIPAMLVVGVVGGVLYTLAGSWTIGALLNRQGAWLLGEASNSADSKVIAGGLALLAGAVFAAVWTRKFRLRAPSLAGLVRNGAGGAMMGAGAALVPGGNGTLLLYAMPSASPSGWIAFAAMSATIALTFWPHRRRRRARSTKA
ncbi:YeeE/YedE thiosulfate transporter family protein [Qipengyuania flava]|uniref:YeeE/YedE thiosulfate transporter family protein n=1 Tax=Qipengyuania flava TaxID=192812 RepID=UPI001C62A566|nr:YeeE/YedE thiosulfate transporter family protein [Qipengyuania flava]QYJ07457.1 YeeE/YedE family protein [Qipengyuania flava]